MSSSQIVPKIVKFAKFNRFYSAKATQPNLASIVPNTSSPYIPPLPRANKLDNAASKDAGFHFDHLCPRPLAIQDVPKTQRIVGAQIAAGGFERPYYNVFDCVTCRDHEKPGHIGYASQFNESTGMRERIYIPCPNCGETHGQTGKVVESAYGTTDIPRKYWN